MDLSRALAHGYQCTDVMSGGEGLHQPLFVCLHCPDRGRSLCKPCVLRCHGGHAVREVPQSSAFLSRCSCGQRCPAKLPASGPLVRILPALCSTRRGGREVPIRQAVFVCQDCLVAGRETSLLCSSCAQLCHAGHMVQRWPVPFPGGAACRCSDRLCVAKDLDLNPGRLASLTPRQRALLSLEPTAQVEQVEEAKDGKEEKERCGECQHEVRGLQGEEESGVEGRMIGGEGAAVSQSRLPQPVLYLSISPCELNDDVASTPVETGEEVEHNSTQPAGQEEGRGERQTDAEAEVDTGDTSARDHAQSSGRISGSVLLLSPPGAEQDGVQGREAQERSAGEQSRQPPSPQHDGSAGEPAETWDEPGSVCK